MTLEIAKISKRLGNKWVLRDVCLEVTEGEIFGICGSTASGKSTLLRIVSGDLTSNGGSITLDGRPLGDGCTILGSNEPVSWRNVFRGGNTASTGEAQASAIENALASEWRVLLLDEPFSQMDGSLRRRYVEKLRTCARERGKIIVIASSNFGELTAACDRIAILDNTEVAQVGTPSELYDCPESVRIAQLSGAVNLLTARRISSSDAEVPEFRTIDGEHNIVARRVEKKRLGAIHQNVMLAIRPEQLSLSMGASFPEDNLIKAVVTGTEFCGSTSLIEFEANGLVLHMRVFRIVGLKVGDECMLGLPPYRVIVLKN